MSRRKIVSLWSVVLAFTLILTACGGGGQSTDSGTAGQTSGTGAEQAAGGGEASGQQVELRYALWDSAQLPAYEACVQVFQEQNPGIKVKIEQQGWNDYWAAIQTGFVAGTAPDVFTNHLAYYPEFANKGQLIDIEPLVQREGVDTSIYIGELAQVWSRDGKRYGLPKDWDTIAIAHNKDMFAKAGVDPSITETWTWNPKDGGTFQEVIAKLTLDANGNNALSSSFDPNNIVQYGYAPPSAGGAYGQTEWSWLAVSTGFMFTDGLWATKYYYDDPRLAETLQWYADMANVKKIFVPFTDVASLGASALFGAGKAAMVSVGSWQIGEYLATGQPVAFGRLPMGPEGRKSMFNGLADSIWVGTKHPDEAWKLVKFLASPTCEDIVGEHNVVFPAIQSGVDKRLAVAGAAGVDVSAFTKQAMEPGGTFLFPITDYASEISTIMSETLDAITLGQVRAADALKEANQKINALFN